MLVEGVCGSVCQDRQAAGPGAAFLYLRLDRRAVQAAGAEAEIDKQLEPAQSFSGRNEDSAAAQSWKLCRGSLLKVEPEETSWRARRAPAEYLSPARFRAGNVF